MKNSTKITAKVFRYKKYNGDIMLVTYRNGKRSLQTFIRADELFSASMALAQSLTVEDIVGK